jgi:hypothetical protein
MASFRPLGQFIQFFLDDGTVNNGGSVTFYETDLTTLKNTYSDPALTVLNPNPVGLDAAGRPNSDIWGSGVYGAVLEDENGITIQTLNNIQSGADPGLVIPSLIADYFLTNDGSNLLWQAIKQLPDPTGSSGFYLTTDGTLVSWAALPAPPAPDIVVDSSSFRGGVSTNTSKFLVQVGSDSAPASGLPQTSKVITFPKAFTVCSIAMCMPTTNSQPGGPVVSYNTSAPSSTGVTFGFDIAEGNPTQANFVNPVPFQWVAIGFLTVP